MELFSIVRIHSFPESPEAPAGGTTFGCRRIETVRCLNLAIRGERQLPLGGLPCSRKRVYALLSRDLATAKFKLVAGTDGERQFAATPCV